MSSVLSGKTQELYLKCTRTGLPMQDMMAHERIRAR